MRRVAGEGRVYGPRRGASTGRGVMERVRVYDDERLGNWLLSLLEKRQEMRKGRTRVWHGGNRPRRRACVVSDASKGVSGDGRRPAFPDASASGGMPCPHPAICASGPPHSLQAPPVTSG